MSHRLVLHAVVACVACASESEPAAVADAGELPQPPACEPTGASPFGRGSAALTVVDRSLIGSPAEYAVDSGLRSREMELETSQRARRAAAWAIAARVVAPIEPAKPLGPDSSRELRRWQTWH